CVDVSSSDPAHDGCAGLPAGSLAGKIALLQNSRGDCAMVQKLNAVRAAGAAGAVVFSLDSTVGTSPSELEPAGIPSISIDRNQGRALRSWVRQHPGAPVTISPAVGIQNNTQGEVGQNRNFVGPHRPGHVETRIG